MRHFSYRRLPLYTALASLAFVVVFACIAYYSLQKTTETSDENKVTLVVLKQIEFAVFDLNQFEKEYQTYILTGDTSYLMQMQIVVDSYNEHIKAIEQAGITDVEEMNEFLLFKKLGQQKIALGQSKVQLYRPEGINPASKVIFTKEEQLLTEDLNLTSDKIENSERINLKKYDEEKKLNAKITLILIIVFSLLALVLFTGFAFIVRNSMRARMIAEGRLRTLNADLEHRIKERTLKLSTSETALRRAELIARFGYWTWNIEAERIYFSEGAAHLFGTDKSELTLDEARALPKAEYLEQLREATRNLIEKGTPWDLTFPVIKPVNGPELDLHITAEYNKHTRTVFGIVHDVTNWKRAEDALVHATELADTLISSLPGICYLFDTDLKFIRWNKNTETITGYSAAEIQNMLPTDFFDPADFEHIAQETKKVFETGTGAIEANLLTKDGRKIPFQFNGKTVNYGGRLCLLGMAFDISERKLAQLELEKSEEKYRLMFYNNPMPMFILELPGYNIVDVNDAAVEHYGYGREELKKMTAIELRPKEDIERFKKEIIPTKFQGTNNVGKWRHLKKNGEIIWVEIVAHELPIGGKNLRIILVNDITEREKVLEQLSKNIKELSDYKYALDEGAIVAITDASGVITYANDNFCRISNYRREELIGKTHRVVNSGYHSKEFFRNMWETIGSGKIWRGEVRNRAKNGTIYWTSATIVPFVNEEGKPVQYLSIRQDITERKKAEKQMILSEARLSEAQAVAHVGSWEIDLGTQTELWSDEIYSLYGFRKGEIAAGRDSFIRRIHPDDLEHVNSALKESFESRKDSAISFRFIRKNGEVRFGYSEAKFEFDNHMTPIRVYGIMQDVTEQKKAEEEIRDLNENLEKKIAERTVQLQEANKALESFSYSVSHDLKAPARNIAGFLEIIESTYGDKFDGDLKYLFSRIGVISKRMGNIIDDLLSLARYTKKVLHYQSVDMEQLFSNTFNTLTANAAIHPHFVVDSLPIVEADSSLMEQVVTNLLSNAIKYSSKKDKPEISVGAYENDGMITYWVKDNGAGFDMKNYNRLFSAFQRLHSINEFEGTGVGLVLVKRIIEKHNGFIWAESKVGEGTTFYFSLPLVTQVGIVSSIEEMRG